MYAFSVIGEYLRMAFTSLKANKMRSILTTLGIFIGVTTIITIFTTIQGMRVYVYEQFSNIGASTVYVEKYPWVIQGDFWKYRNRKNVTWKEYQALSKYAHIADHIAPQVLTFRTVKYRNEAYDRIMIIGTTQEYKDTDGVNPENGRFITDLDVRRNHPVCVIGAEIKEKLFKDEAALGKRIKIGSKKYRVAGILEKRGNFFGQSMDNYVIVPIGTIQGSTGTHRGMRIALAVRDNAQLDNLKDEIRGIMRKVRKVAPMEEDDFAINQQDQLAQTFESITGPLFAIVFVIGGISLLVGGIGIMNIMLVSVTERTKEIGIRKAIGARKRNILSQFLIESVAIASIGGGLGILAGYLLGNLLLSAMDLSIGVSVSSIMIGFGFSTTVGILAGFYPAWKAAKLNPIDALHYE